MCKVHIVKVVSRMGRSEGVEDAAPWARILNGAPKGPAEYCMVLLSTRERKEASFVPMNCSSAPLPPSRVSKCNLTPLRFPPDDNSWPTITVTFVYLYSIHIIYI